MGLEVKDVNKNFGTKHVVDNLSFTIDKPGAFGLLGTNGAGKTTTIRMILGIIKKDTGTINWNGKEVQREYVKFGYLPEERGIYPKTKVYDQLMYFAKLKGMSKLEADKSIKYWLNRLELEEYTNMPAEKLSKGNQQKVQFITAVMHDPELIVLDEPFSGLDPINTETLKDIMVELINKNKYIIMSSHQMSSIEEFCTDLVILDRGKTVVKGNLNKIKNSYKANKLEIEALENIDNLIKGLGLSVIFAKDNVYEVSIKDEEEGHKLYNLLAEKNIKVNKFELKKPSLHDIFIEKVGASK